MLGRKIEIETTLVCPHDETPMSKVDVRGVVIDRCDACGGTWFDAKELRRVAEDKEVEQLAAREPMVKVQSPFACPRCGGACVEGRVSEVEIDTCTECHGVWLDSGELAEARRLVHADRLILAQGSGFRAFLSRI